MGVKLGWGKRKSDGVMISIMDADRGLSCQCICPECGTDLFAKKGNVNEPHFAHAGDILCRWAPETALHELAKQIIQKSKYILLPDSRKFFYDKVTIEKSLPGMRADAFISNGVEEYMVEIVVTHEVGFNKEEKIIINGHKAIVIDISEIDRSIKEEELRQIVIEDSFGKYMIFNDAPASESKFAVESDKDPMLIVALLFSVLFCVWIVFKWLRRTQRRRNYAWR